MVIACSRRGLWPSCDTKGAVTSKIKHAIKLKTSPARLAQLLQPSSAFCFSLQAAAKNKKKLMWAATVVQVLQDLFYVLLHVLFYLWSLLNSVVVVVVVWLMVIAATDLRWGGRLYYRFFCRSSKNVAVKELLKSVNIWVRNDENIKRMFFYGTQCIISLYVEWLPQKKPNDVMSHICITGNITSNSVSSEQF